MMDEQDRIKALEAMPAKRREALLGYVLDRTTDPIVGESDPMQTVAAHVINKVLEHFEETDPKVALAIREGIPETVPEDVIRYGLRGFDAHGYATEMDDPDLTTLIIDYPPDHKNLTE